jgi:glycosyltransferase involved in cell wall biosynthesis
MLGKMPKRAAAGWISAATMTVALVRGPRFIWKDATQNKYFDSLAAGKPVASNYDGWQAEVATAAGAGIILDSADHEKAAQQLVRAIRDGEWLRAASKAAMNLARNVYSRDEHALQLERVLKDAISSPRSA